MSALNKLAAVAATLAIAAPAAGCRTITRPITHGVVGRSAHWVNSIGETTCESVMKSIGDKGTDVSEDLVMPTQEVCYDAASELAAMRSEQNNVENVCTDAKSGEIARGIIAKVTGVYENKCASYIK